MMAKFSSLLLTLALFTCQVTGERPPNCFGDEVTIDLSNPSAVRPLIYTLDKTQDSLPPGLALDRRTGVVSGVLRDTGFQNAYNISVIGTDPTDSSVNYEDLWHVSTRIKSEWCTGSRVSRFLLINTDTNKIVRVVHDGDEIDLGCHQGGFSMEVETFCEFSREAQSEGDLTSRVDFTLDGSHVSTETTFPYALGGNVNGKYIEFPIKAGEHVLTATPYNPSGDKGFQKTITFTILERMQVKQATHESLYGL